jgi:hypothetical protein
MSEKASSAYEVEIVPHRTFGEQMKRALHMWFIRPAPDPDPAEYDVTIIDRSTRKVVRSIRTWSGPPANEVMSGVEQDLETLDPVAFCAKYGIDRQRTR